MRDAPIAEVQSTIAGVAWPEQKAPRILQILCEITERRGELSLDFLAELTVAEARQWLESLPGVGPKTSAATLLFSRLRMPPALCPTGQQLHPELAGGAEPIVLPRPA